MYYNHQISMCILSTYDAQHYAGAQERWKVKMIYFKHHSSLSAAYIVIGIESDKLASNNLQDSHSSMNFWKHLRLNISFFHWNPPVLLHTWKPRHLSGHNTSVLYSTHQLSSPDNSSSAMAISHPSLSFLIAEYKESLWNCFKTSTMLQKHVDCLTASVSLLQFQRK